MVIVLRKVAIIVVNTRMRMFKAHNTELCIALYEKYKIYFVHSNFVIYLITRN